LGNVDNTADASKPVSTAMQTALDGKAATSHTHSLASLTQSSATTGQVVAWNGTAWAAATPSGGGGGSANIVEATTAAGFPATGSAGTLYHATNVRRIFFWDASGVYVEAGTSGGGGDGSDLVLRALFLPPAPTGVTGVAGNAQATVSWTAPTVLSQTPITDYTVQYSSNSGSTWTTVSRSASAAASATVTGLTNGTAYAFRVAAVNGVGTGTYSSASSAVTIGLVAQKSWVSAVSTDGLWEISAPNSAAIGTVARLTDGNSATGGGTDESARYIQIDLGTSRTITGVFIQGLTISGYWNPVYTANRSIRVSVDGSSWTTYATTGSASEVSSLVSYSGAPVACRYIQLYQSTAGYIAVSEFYPGG
jgi:hypothetical protein